MESGLKQTEAGLDAPGGKTRTRHSPDLTAKLGRRISEADPAITQTTTTPRPKSDAEQLREEARSIKLSHDSRAGAEAKILKAEPAKLE
jgi:hypothetical protein